MITRPREIEISAQTLRGVMDEFMSGAERLQELREAYEGKSAITKRTREKGLPNNRLVHAFPRYIVTMAAGYLAGSPIQYSVQENAQGLDRLKAAYKQCDMDSVDAELAVQAAIYGRSVCLCFADEQARPRAATLSPQTAFVVYDDTVESKPLFGVYWYKEYDEHGKECGVHIHAYDEGYHYEYRGETMAQLAPEGSIRAHYFGACPMIEFWNTADERGDFESVLSLINAYDILESDRINDKEQFTDAILLLTGCSLSMEGGEDAFGTGDGTLRDLRSPAQKLREEKTLALPDSDAKAEWLIKQSDESGNEILRNAIKSDIHKMSMIPDLTDENFAANASGVAMRYKLFGLEQLTKNKERWFRQGLRERLARFNAFLRTKGAAAITPEEVSITFTRALPVNETEIAQMVATLRGMVPSEILLSQLPFIDDPERALAQLTAEQGSKEEKDKTENTQA